MFDIINIWTNPPERKHIAHNNYEFSSLDIKEFTSELKKHEEGLLHLNIDRISNWDDFADLFICLKGMKNIRVLSTYNLMVSERRLDWLIDYINQTPLSLGINFDEEAPIIIPPSFYTAVAKLESINMYRLLNFKTRSLCEAIRSSGYTRLRMLTLISCKLTDDDFTQIINLLPAFPICVLNVEGNTITGKSFRKLTELLLTQPTQLGILDIFNTRIESKDLIFFADHVYKFYRLSLESVKYDDLYLKNKLEAHRNQKVIMVLLYALRSCFTFSNRNPRCFAYLLPIELIKRIIGKIRDTEVTDKYRFTDLTTH